MDKTNRTLKLPQIAIPQPTPSWLQNFPPLLQQARIFSNNDQDKEALTLALAEYKRQPSLDALEHAFDSCVVLEQPKKAQALLKEMKKLGATTSFLNLQKVTYYVATQNPIKAQSYLNQVLPHKKELDTRHRAYLYFTQGVVSFINNKPQKLPFTQALRYSYLLMPSERSMCYLMRGLIRLNEEAYEAAYQDAQGALHEKSKEDVTHYLRALSGYHSGHLTRVKQDIEIVLQSKDELVDNSMKSTMRQIQKLLPKEPVVIDKDFMSALSHRFFDEIDDMIDSTETLSECLTTWIGIRFENKMDNSIQKSLEYLRESLSKLKAPDLPKKLKEIKDYLQLYTDRHFSQACLDLKAPAGPDITRAQLRTWRKQLLAILGHYNKAYDALVDKVAELADLYHIPVFVEKIEQHTF